jgi:hypothetical protein
MILLVPFEQISFEIHVLECRDFDAKDLHHLLPPKASCTRALKLGSIGLKRDIIYFAICGVKDNNSG